MPQLATLLARTSSNNAKLIADFPWELTSVGPMCDWSPAMKSTISLILQSPVPIVTLWGDKGVMIYNDAYSVFAEQRHPRLLGSNVREGWPEVADFNDNVMKAVMAGGTLSYVDQELTLHRSGKPEQVFMNLDYSPVLGDDGSVIGVFAVVVESTDKVRAQRRLTAERAQLAQMFAQAPGFMALVTGPKYTFELINEAYDVLVGRRHTIGRTVREAFPELDKQGFSDLLDEAFNSGQPVKRTSTPFALKHGDAAERTSYLDFVLQPLLDSQGAVYGIFIQGADVTERVSHEQLLQQSETKFRTFAQAMPHHVWTAPSDGNLDWCNDRVYEYTGLAPGALNGEAWARVIAPDDVSEATSRWQKSVSAGEPYEVEFRIRRHDGVYRWHLARAVPIKDQAGAIARWIGSSTDIDDQKTATQALASMNATLEDQVTLRTAERDRMWRLSKDIMLVADFESTIEAVSPAFTSLLGWTTEEVIGRQFMDLVHPEDRDATLRQVSSLHSGGAVFRFQNRYRRKDGSYCPLSWTASPDDKYIHAVGRDITADLRQAEVIKEAQVALQQAQKMETIGKLTGGVAHDFNNLLQVISGNLQLLGPQLSDRPELRKRVDNAMAGVERGAKLASHLLAFARKQPLEPKVVKLSKVLTNMEDMLRRTLGEEVEIETVMSGGLWSTAVDVVQTENAILNLAINARDAMSGRGKLTVEVGNAYLDATYCAGHSDVTPGQYVMIAVSDTGSGMPPDVMAQAFEPFFSTKQEGKGTGLGLSMVYGLVKQSGGHIKIYSEVGEGTTVKLYLPRSHEQEDTYTALATQPVVGGSETVLVAEDDEQVRSTVVDMLIELGYNVLKAPDASSALTVIDSGVHIDLLFTDVVMPGPLRSPELAKRAKERLPQLAVLFTSGYTENAIVHGGRLDHGVELIGKPYSKESLAKKIRHVLNNEKQRTPGTGKVINLPMRPTVPRQNGPVKQRIVLVEDDAAILANTRDLLSYLGHDVLAVENAELALRLLDESIDCIIADLELPGMPGNELLQIASKAVPRARLVIASGYGVAGIDIPGVQYISKPYGIDALRALLAGT